MHALVDGKSPMLSFAIFGDGTNAVSARTCRDCGNVLERTARGCPRCALNFEAEAMIDRFVWRRVVPGLVVAVLGIVVLVYWILK